MITIGITGSLSSGKTEVAKILSKMGAHIFDADESAKNAVLPGKPAYKAIVKIFGKSFLQKNGQIDRKKLAQHVFSNPKDLKKLNILLHPGVIFECLGQIEKMKNKKGLLVLDAPLLFESKMESLADYTVVVNASQKKTIDRSVKKGLTRDLAKKILSTQWPIEKKIRIADFVIENNGTMAQLKKEVVRVVKEIEEACNQKVEPFYGVKSAFAIKV